MPSTRYYVEDNGSMYNRLAQVLGSDIYKIISSKICAKKAELPILYRIMQQSEFQAKLEREESGSKKSSQLLSSQRMKPKLKDSMNSGRSGMSKANVSRMQSKAIQIQDSKGNLVLNDEVGYDEAEQEDDALSFEA